MISGQRILTTAQILHRALCSGALQHLFYPKDRIHSPYHLIEVTKKVANEGERCFLIVSNKESATSGKESATSGKESATSGKESATSGKESATSGSHPPFWHLFERHTHHHRPWQHHRHWWPISWPFTRWAYIREWTHWRGLSMGVVEQEGTLRVRLASDPEQAIADCVAGRRGGTMTFSSLLPIR
jgi:hypothetical protein